jgi:uncharacterized membrane protein/protein-disulfide isomerase
MTTLSRNLLLACAALGLAASSTSGYVHYRLLTQPSYTSFCDVNETVSCTQAYLSRYGSFMGVPVALAGVAFFALVLALAAAARGKTHAADSAPGYIFALSTVGFAFVLYLGWASYVVLKAFCMLCAITYVAVIALFIISGGATSFPMTSLPRRALRDARTLITSPVALVVLLLLVLGTGSLIAFFPHGGTQAAAPAQAGVSYPPLTDQDRANLEKWWDVQRKEDLPIPTEGAKVVIVKFSDFMCPGCRQTYEAYKPIVEKYAGNKDVKFITKQYPLEPECNQYVPTGTHFASCEAAAAVVMARSRGTADKLEEWLFTNQATLTRDVVRKAAAEIGAVPDFDARYDSAMQEVKMDAGLGGLLHIESTPTFFINGRRIKAGIAPQAFDGLIELELKRAR